MTKNKFDLSCFLEVTAECDYADLNYRFTQLINSFVYFVRLGILRTHKRNKNDIKAICSNLEKIHKLLEQNICIQLHLQKTVDKGVECGFPDGLSYDDCKKTNNFIKNISTIRQIFQMCYLNFGNERGRKIKSFPSLDAIKEQFVESLYYVYLETTERKPTPRGGGSQKDSDFIMFAKSVLNTINEVYPTLENGHNISISFNDYLKRRAKKAKSQHFIAR